jgi:hypothetical protein
MNHRRLVFPRAGSPVPNDHANLYRWGGPSGPAPLLVYVGGQIGLKKHAERFQTEPTPVVDEFLKASGGEPPARLDLLVVPAPPLPRTAGASPHEDFEDFFEHELLPAIDAPAPEAIGFVGYSYGAFLATFVALGLEEARALVTLGGVGISRAIQLAKPIVVQEIVFEVHRNDGDEADSPVVVARSTLPPAKARAMPPRPGGHGFHHYARNGTAADAFRSALRAVMGGVGLGAR